MTRFNLFRFQQLLSDVITVTTMMLLFVSMIYLLVEIYIHTKYWILLSFTFKVAFNLLCLRKNLSKLVLRLREQQKNVSYIAAILQILSSFNRGIYLVV